MIEGIVNMRDLGGIATRDGRVLRARLLYRSGHLGALQPGGDRTDDQPADPDAADTEQDPAIDLAAFSATGIRWVADLRSEAEVQRSPDRVPDGVVVAHLDVLEDAEESIATHLEEIYADPANAAAVLAGGLIDRHYEDTYRKLVRLDSARAAYTRLFRQVIETDEPMLFHCTAGKDRTGWAAASLLTLLGVEHTTVVEDYLRSNAPVLAAFRPLLDHFAEIGGDPTVVEPAFLVATNYLDAAFGAALEDHGSIERYFTEALGLGPEHQDALRRKLLRAPLG